MDDVLEQILGQRYGNSINAMYHCPFHEDRTPSLSAHREDGVWKCHQCLQAGDIEKLALLTGEQLDPSFVWGRAIRKTLEVPPVEHDFGPLANSLYEAGISDKRGDRAIRSYMRSRSISMDARHHFWLGWDGSRISFPYWYDDARKRGRCTGIKYRDMAGHKSYETGSKHGIYNVEEVRGAGHVIICEGETDTLMAWSNAPKPWRVCGVPGAKSSRLTWENRALDFLFAREILVMFDADEAGDTGAETAIEVLGPKARRIRPEEGLDLTEHFQKYGELPGELSN